MGLERSPPRSALLVLDMPFGISFTRIQVLSDFERILVLEMGLEPTHPKGIRIWNVRVYHSTTRAKMFSTPSYLVFAPHSCVAPLRGCSHSGVWLQCVVPLRGDSHFRTSTTRAGHRSIKKRKKNANFLMEGTPLLHHLLQFILIWIPCFPIIAIYKQSWYTGIIRTIL